MGITIHYKLGQDPKYVKSTLDIAENIAREMKEEADKIKTEFEIFRESERDLLINIGECESLSFNFRTMEEIEKEKGYSYTEGVLSEKKLDEGLEYTADFCKTQFAKSVFQHKWVADIIKVVASFCQYAEVYDEGDYYHTGKLEDADKNIAELGKMIDGIGEALEKVAKKNKGKIKVEKGVKINKGRS
jgi:hypothetical protein